MNISPSSLTLTPLFTDYSRMLFKLIIAAIFTSLGLSEQRCPANPCG
jgi:hypothetical protein